MENCVPVVVTTVDGNTVAAVFWETDLYEVVADLDEDKLKEGISIAFSKMNMEFVSKSQSTVKMVWIYLKLAKTLLYLGINATKSYKQQFGEQ